MSSDQYTNFCLNVGFKENNVNVENKNSKYFKRNGIVENGDVVTENSEQQRNVSEVKSSEIEKNVMQMTGSGVQNFELRNNVKHVIDVKEVNMFKRKSELKLENNGIVKSSDMKIVRQGINEPEEKNTVKSVKKMSIQKREM